MGFPDACSTGRKEQIERDRTRTEITKEAMHVQRSNEARS